MTAGVCCGKEPLKTKRRERGGEREREKETKIVRKKAVALNGQHFA
jgi:hypothetical protein